MHLIIQNLEVKIHAV